MIGKAVYITLDSDVFQITGVTVVDLIVLKNNIS